VRSLWLLLLVLAGCAARPGAPSTSGVVVTAVELDFPERDRGALAFTLRLPPGLPPAAQVSWELFLDGARFAAGIDGDVPPKDGLCQVKSALASKHLVWREGDGWLDVVLQGEVDLGQGERLPFRDRRELLVHGRPQLNIPRD
jgi:hypothetical protein